MRFFVRKFCRLALLLLALALPVLVACAATSVKDYAARLGQAAQRLDPLLDGEATDEEIARTMNDLKRSFATSEEVTFNGRTIRTDNGWLHEAADEVIKSAGGDAEQRRNLLVVLKDRLTALRARIEPPQAVPVSAPNLQSGEQTKLKEILARPEYALETKQESTVKRWWENFWRWLDRQLARLFRPRGAVSRESAATTTTLVRVLLVAALAGALLFGLVKLARRRQRRRKDDEDGEGREVLGEQIAADATANDLLAEASTLAGRGDYRAAIRRTYIALLVEMEARGKLRLHRSKTNRDYLDAVKTKEAAAAESQVYPSFAAMTGTFEHVWYGQAGAGEPQFNDYLSKFRETTKQ